MKYTGKKEYRLLLIDMLRGAILVQCQILYPSACYRSHLLNLADEGLTEQDVDIALAWLRDKGWITSDTRHILGREDLAVRLTAAGIDVALQIDPDSPRVPREYNQ